MAEGELSTRITIFPSKIEAAEVSGRCGKLKFGKRIKPFSRRNPLLPDFPGYMERASTFTFCILFLIFSISFLSAGLPYNTWQYLCAAAVFAQQGQDLTLMQLQTDRFVCHDLSEALGDVSQFDCVCQASHPFCLGIRSAVLQKRRTAAFLASTRKACLFNIERN